MPCLNASTLKLISNPRDRLDSFRYDSIWALWMGGSDSTDFNSTITESSTRSFPIHMPCRTHRPIPIIRVRVPGGARLLNQLLFQLVYLNLQSTCIIPPFSASSVTSAVKKTRKNIRFPECMPVPEPHAFIDSFSIESGPIGRRGFFCSQVHGGETNEIYINGKNGYKPEHATGMDFYAPGAVFFLN